MSYHPGVAHDARLETGEAGWTLIFIRELRHRPEAVWAALTDPAQLGRWAPFTAPRDLGTTGDTVLTMVDGDTTEDLPSTVLRADRPRLLEHSWGDDLLRWELEPTEAGTRLVLRHTGDEPDYETRVASGWHICLVVMASLLDGEPTGVIRGEDAREHGYEELRVGYAKLFGLE